MSELDNAAATGTVNAIIIVIALCTLALLLTGCASAPASPPLTGIWAFMSDSPVLTFFLAYLAYYSLRQLSWLIALPFRAAHIRKHGWPPAYLDADGDHKGKAAKTGDDQ